MLELIMPLLWLKSPFLLLKEFFLSTLVASSTLYPWEKKRHGIYFTPPMLVAPNRTQTSPLHSLQAYLWSTPFSRVKYCYWNRLKISPYLYIDQRLPHIISESPRLLVSPFQRLGKIKVNHQQTRGVKFSGALLQIEAPWMCPSISTFCKRDVKPSAHKRNR